MMTSLTSTIQRQVDRLAKIIGHMVLRLIMITVVAAGVVALGNALGMSDYTSTSAPAPAVATPTEGPTETVPAVGTSAPTPAAAPSAAAPSGELASGRTVLVALHATEVSAALWNDLLDLQWHGQRGDGTDDVIYAPVNLVIFDEIGTWTITLDGPARCEHGSARPCSGAEWVR